MQVEQQPDAMFAEIFAKLKPLLAQYSQFMNVTANSTVNYSLDTHRIMEQNGKPLFFGAVQIKKNYVSYHLMPVYVCPELLAGISPELGKRMQGKSCFNFKKVDEALFRELDELTAKGYSAFESRGYLTHGGTNYAERH